MKKLLILFTGLALLVSNSAFSQKADDILGVWLSGSKKAHVEIYKQGDKFYGKIVWLRDPLDDQGKPKVDKNNPDKGKKTVPLIGLNLLKGFEFDEDEWEDGTIYDPENGKTYSCVITLKDKNTMNVRGYIGISMIGRTEAWLRVK